MEVLRRMSKLKTLKTIEETHPSLKRKAIERARDLVVTISKSTSGCKIPYEKGYHCFSDGCDSGCPECLEILHKLNTETIPEMFKEMDIFTCEDVQKHTVDKEKLSEAIEKLRKELFEAHLIADGNYKDKQDMAIKLDRLAFDILREFKEELGLEEE